MKMMKMLGAVMMALCFSAATHAQTESLTVPLSEPGKPFKLNVDLVNGGITITGYEGKDIIIEAQAGNDRKKRKGGGGDMNINVNVNVNGSGSKENTGGMRRLGGANTGLEMDAREKNNVVTINTDSYKRGIDLNIKVPMSAGTLKVKAVNDGDIVINNVNGELEVENVNGAITLSNIAGTAVANTINGNLVVGFRSIDGKSPMAFSSLNGKLDITFPATLKANLKAKSDRGEVYSDFDVTIDKVPAKVTRTAEKGMYKLNIDDWIYGKVNGGGPEILMKTMNGNIYVRKAK